MNRFAAALILLLLAFPALSQDANKLDSLEQLRQELPDSEEKVKVLTSLYNMFLYSDREKAKAYVEEALLLSRAIDFKKGIAMSQYNKGVYFNNTSDIDSAQYYYLESKQLFQELEDAEYVLRVNHALAILEYYQGHYEEAIDILRSNIIIHNEQQYDSVNDERMVNLAVAYDLLGQIELFRGNYKLALQEALKALKILENVDKPIRKADAPQPPCSHRVLP